MADDVYTLAHAIFGKASIYAVCPKCGHFGVISFDQTCALGQRTPVADVEKRFRCRVCKTRGAKIQSDKPLVGTRICPECHTPMWKPHRMDVAANVPRCTRCLAPMRR